METNYQQDGPDGKMEAEEFEGSLEKTSVMDEIEAAAIEEQLLTFPNAAQTSEAMKVIQAQHAAITNGLKKSVEVAVENEGDCPDDTCDGSGYYQDENGKNVPCLHTVEARGDDEKDRDY